MATFIEDGRLIVDDDGSRTDLTDEARRVATALAHLPASIPSARMGAPLFELGQDVANTFGWFDLLTEEVEFCGCTNEELEEGRTCGQVQCPNRGPLPAVVLVETNGSEPETTTLLRGAPITVISVDWDEVENGDNPDYIAELLDRIEELGVGQIVSPMHVGMPEVVAQLEERARELGPTARATA